METPLISIPFPIKDIWHVIYFEKELILAGIIVAGALIYYCYQVWSRFESIEEMHSPRPKTNWSALYRTLNPKSPDFAKRIESLLIEFAEQEFAITLRDSLTAEEKSRLVASPEISRCLKLARDIRYSKSGDQSAKIQELDTLASRIFAP